MPLAAGRVLALLRGYAIGLVVAFVVGLLAILGRLAPLEAWTLKPLLGGGSAGEAPRWIRVVLAGSAALVLGYCATVLETVVRLQREKPRLSPFFSPGVLREIVRRRDRSSLASSRRLVTVLFSDLHGFTSLSEKLPPARIDEMLREYLSETTEIVFKYRGAIDKYIGDRVMALYNVPLEDEEHALNAIRTALDVQEWTLDVSARWRAKFGVSIRSGVGINTGEAVVGTIGSTQRPAYTAIGDTVNLASRLPSIAKEHKTSVIISESTYRCVQGRFLTREVGNVTVQGKRRRVKVFAVMPNDIRKHPRAALEAGARLDRMGGGTAHVRTRDISEGGLAVSGVPEDWDVGSLVLIRCEGHWLPKPLGAAGTIVWRRGGDAGILFRALDPDAVPAVVERASRRR